MKSQAQLKLADTLKKLGEQADKNGLELDLDIAGDMAALKVVHDDEGVEDFKFKLTFKIENCIKSRKIECSIFFFRKTWQSSNAGNMALVLTTLISRSLIG